MVDIWECLDWLQTGNFKQETIPHRSQMAPPIHNQLGHQVVQVHGNCAVVVNQKRRALGRHVFHALDFVTWQGRGSTLGVVYLLYPTNQIMQ